MTVTISDVKVFDFLNSLTIEDIELLGRISELNYDINSDKNELVDGLAAIMTGERIRYDSIEDTVVVDLVDFGGLNTTLAYDEETEKFSFDNAVSIAIKGLVCEFKESWLEKHFDMYSYLKDNEKIEVTHL